MLNTLGLNADAGIADTQAYSIAVSVDLQAHAALTGKLDGVTQQIGQHLPHPHGVTTVMLLLRVIVELERQALLTGFQRKYIDQLSAQVAQREGVFFKLDRSLLQLGSIKNVVKQPEQ